MDWVRAVSLLVHFGLSLVAVQGQGTLTFLNTSSGTGVPGGAPVADVDGTTRLAGAGFFAQLYASPVNDEGSLVPIGMPVPFRTGAAAGFIAANQVAVPGAPSGTYVFVQMRAWDNGGGVAFSYERAIASGLSAGESNMIEVGPLGFVCPVSCGGVGDPGLIGLLPFSLVPEPSARMLALVGALVMAGIGWVRGKYTSKMRSEL